LEPPPYLFDDETLALTGKRIDEIALASLPITAKEAYARFEIDQFDTARAVHERIIPILYRDRIRINYLDWSSITQRDENITEHGVAKQFILHIYRSHTSVQIASIRYRYKQRGDKKWHEVFEGILIDSTMSASEQLMRLAVWFSAQKFANQNLQLMQRLVTSALSTDTSI
jgi:hypothetical protein